MPIGSYPTQDHHKYSIWPFCRFLRV
ncbi:Protein of unknown function [Pyronema omphalodes CBS 100304]|uniref:Uncharacterized protein n=1 Tax=Pyronema omphalodes (strain CBS 100304) TaxID=1076935 RepID=U4LKV3_PYROM|nr:Protein of unknown function [Pyronema omphalodes CBS 100304]